jgi:hypothetical protein
MQKAISTENGLEDALKDWLKGQSGVWYFKVVGGPYQQAGVPDVIICWHGTFVAVELKKPGRISTTKEYKPSSPTEILQVKNIGLITKAGGVAFIADDLAVIKSTLLSIDNMVSSK